MKFHLVIASPSFEEGLRFFRDELGFSLEKITPSENPSLAVLSGHGLNICLDKKLEADQITIRVSTEDRDLVGTKKVGPNGTQIIYELDLADTPSAISNDPSVAINEASNALWTTGRAGMKYRNLLPEGDWDYIASHIRIPGSGEVPDWVHYHDAQFQIIYCYKGSAKLVYEDQGPPFIFNAGDCVLQPPHIRHQVLESYDDLEVVEIVTPFHHSTFTDHMMQLPNSAFKPDRNFMGQRFIWDQIANREWQSTDATSNFPYEVGVTGIYEASARIGDVRILRPKENKETQVPLIPFPEQNASDFVLWFILSGTALYDRPHSVPSQKVFEGDAISLINAGQEGIGAAFRDPSLDFSLLEVRLPSEISGS